MRDDEFQAVVARPHAMAPTHYWSFCRYRRTDRDAARPARRGTNQHNDVLRRHLPPDEWWAILRDGYDCRYASGHRRRRRNRGARSNVSDEEFIECTGGVDAHSLGVTPTIGVKLEL